MTPPNNRSPNKLVEGRDYYIENGRWVFTAEYHARRGHCCASGCRHCPYEPIHEGGCILREPETHLEDSNS